MAVPVGHAWAGVESIELEQLVATPLIMRDPGANTRRTVEVALAPLGLSLHPPLAEVGSTSAAMAAAVSEGAPALLSSLAVAGDSALVARPIEGLDLSRRFELLLGGGDAPTPAARALANHLLQAGATPAVPITAG